MPCRIHVLQFAILSLICFCNGMFCNAAETLQMNADILILEGNKSDHTVILNDKTIETQSSNVLEALKQIRNSNNRYLVITTVEKRFSSFIESDEEIAFLNELKKDRLIIEKPGIQKYLTGVAHIIVSTERNNIFMTWLDGSRIKSIPELSSVVEKFVEQKAKVIWIIEQPGFHSARMDEQWLKNVRSALAPLEKNLLELRQISEVPY